MIFPNMKNIVNPQAKENIGTGKNINVLGAVTDQYFTDVKPGAQALSCIGEMGLSIMPGGYVGFNFTKALTGEDPLTGKAFNSDDRIRAFLGAMGGFGLGDPMDTALPPIDKPVIVIGENMQDRVLPTAQTLNDLGYDVHTWPAENFRSTFGNIDPRDMEANRSWLSYWIDQDATVVDLGIDPLRDQDRSPWYELERRSIYENWDYPNVIRPK
jgi:hypothetical protein